MARHADDITERDRTVDVTDSAVPPPPPSMPMAAAGNGAAIAAFVLGLLALVLTFTIALAPIALIFGLIAVFAGFKGRGNAKRLNGLHKGLATSGLVTGLVALLLLAAATVAGFQLLDANPELRDDLRNAVEGVQS